MHIYIHIPFCESKCPYCAFGSHSDKFNITKEYFKALAKEIKSIKFKDKISTIFIGGGTPSSVEAGLYDDIFEYLMPNLDINCEITSEANPNSANLNWLKYMRKLGVNRLSLGAQSFNENKLRKLEPFFENLSKNSINQILTEAKYYHYIAQQHIEVEKMKGLLNIKIPNDLDFKTISGLSNEVVEKLIKFAPPTLAAASNLSGITPAAIDILHIAIKRHKSTLS